jgi:hypothetical protein
MGPMLEGISVCRKQKQSPNVALALVAAMMCGKDLATDKELMDYCEKWIEEHGKITYKKVFDFVEKLGYEREIAEISLCFDWSPDFDPNC